MPEHARPGRVFLVRHAEADYETLHHHQPVYRGARYDLAPLTPLGSQQAERLAVALGPYEPTLLVSSPYTRALHTAAVLAVELRCRLTVDLQLHDWLPVRDGASVITPDLVRQKVAEYDAWKRGGQLPANRTWESDEEMRERAMAVAHRHAMEPSVVIVSHEAVIKAATGAQTVPLGSCHPLLVDDG